MKVLGLVVVMLSQFLIVVSILLRGASVITAGKVGVVMLAGSAFGLMVVLGFKRLEVVK